MYNDHKSKVNVLQWSKLASEKLFASGGADGSIWVQNLEDSKSNYTLVEHWGEVLCLSFDPNQKYLASGDSKGVLIIWSTEDYRVLKIFYSKNQWAFTKW